MKSAPNHPKEYERLLDLLRYEVLDSEDEQVFDDLTELACNICETPISLISLVDDHRQWFKSKVGLDASETPKSIAFCSHAILQDKVFEVSNTLKDNRFHDNPLVTSAPEIRFYAGAPLISPRGYPIGTLCVIDRQSKALTKAQQQALEILAKQVVSQLELRLHNHRLERISKEREHIYATIAHDLRSPFNGILGLSKILSKCAHKLDSNIIIDSTKHILGSSLRVYQLLDELLQWSQVSMGAQHYQPKVINIYELIDTSIELLNEALGLKSLHIKDHVSQELEAFADPILTKAIIRNLLANAIKYSPENGAIIVSAKKKEGLVKITVQDHGKGIPEEITDSLFTASTQSQCGTYGEKGFGLGLNLCQEFVALQQGEIWVEKNDHKGASISFSLPTTP